MSTYQQTYAEVYGQNAGYYAGFLFLVWPLLAVVSAFRNYKKAWAKNVFWAFCAFYGYTFAIGPEGSGMDIHFYVQDYKAMHQVHLSFTEVIQTIWEYDQIDFVRILISVVLSRFTDHPTVLTLVYGTIFGYFLSRNIWFILNRLEGKIAPVTILLILCFFLVNPIWNINGFRMWTAAQIFLFGLLPYLFDGRKNYLWVAAISIFVHFSFIVPIGVLFGYLLMGNRLTIYFGFYLSTLFMSELDITLFNQVVEAYLPEMFQERTAGYRSEAHVESIEAGAEASTRNWYAIWYGRALNYSIMGFMVLLYVMGRGFIRDNSSWHNLFSFTLLFYGVANILSFVPSGGRFVTIANLCSLALVALYVQNRPREKSMKRFIWFAVPALLLFIVVSVRVGLFSISATVIMGNPVVAAIISGEHLSMNEVMRMIL